MAKISGDIRILKYLFFLFTFFFVITGIVLISLAIALHSRDQAFAQLLPHLPFLNIANLLTVVGVIVFLVSFAGCFGTMRENKVWLTAFILALVVIFFLELIIGVVGFVNRDKVDTYVTDDLKHGLNNYNKSKAYGSAWDTIQSSLECCGVMHPDDWYLNTTIFKVNQVPDTCCVEVEPKCGRRGVAIHSMGCKEAMINVIEANFSGVAAGGIIIAIFELCGIFVALLVLRSIGKGENV